MYYAYFGLSHAPFKITPDTEVFFEGGNRGAILEALIYAITQGEGIIKVTGEVGSGKTMLCRVLQSRLPEQIETVYIANPSVSPAEILHAIAFELQLPIPRDAGRLEVMHAINHYLLERHSQKRQVVLFVEESQGMPIATLEEVRLLSNLETDHYKLLQIVLFGQPELDENLRQAQIRQLKERITHSFVLNPLTEDEVRDYLSFRLRAANYRGPDLFSKRVVKYITHASAGLTRRVNIIAEKALLAAFADNTHTISLPHVRAAVRDSEFSDHMTPNEAPAVTYGIVGLIAGGIIGGAGFSVYQHFHGREIREANPPEVVSPSVTPPPQQGAALAANMQPAGMAGNPSFAPRPPAPPQNTVTSDSYLSDDVVARRMAATDQWLDAQAMSTFSIQLAGAGNEEVLRDYFKIISKYLEIEEVFVYRTMANRKPSLSVLYGTFKTRSEVLRVLDSLPPELKANNPYYRTIQGIRAEIAANKS
jgi:type II secretory pathway predicted ATPase ExeA